MSDQWDTRTVDIKLKRRSRLERLIRLPWLVYQNYQIFRRVASSSPTPPSKWTTLRLSWTFAATSIKN